MSLRAWLHWNTPGCPCSGLIFGKIGQFIFVLGVIGVFRQPDHEHKPSFGAEVEVIHGHVGYLAEIVGGSNDLLLSEGGPYLVNGKEKNQGDDKDGDEAPCSCTVGILLFVCE